MSNRSSVESRRRSRHQQGAAAGHLGDVRFGPLRSIGVLLREMGHDPAAVLAECGLERAAFDDPEQRVPFGIATRLVQRAAWVTGRPDFALFAGRRFELGDLGLLGQLMARAGTVGEALEDLQRFFHLQDRGSVAYLRSTEQGVVALGYSILDPETPGAGLTYDLVMSIAMSTMRALAGPRFRANEVCLAHVAPPNKAPYWRCFLAPVSFDAPQTELRFAAAWLEAPVAGADPTQHARAQSMAQSAEARGPLGLPDRVRTVVRVLLSAGKLSTRHVAEALDMHERTLRRQLAAEGVHLHEMVATTRFEVARLLLDETRLPLNTIAMAVGYTETSSFVRAFSNWAGCTPGNWRARAASAAGTPPAASFVRFVAP